MKIKDIGIGMTIGIVFTSLFHMSEPEVCKGCEKECAEVAECITPTLQEIETTPAAIAQFCQGLATECERFPLWLTPDCDCEIDYNNGFENGFKDGVGEGWKSCETITVSKEDPRKEIFSARNKRESKKIFNSATQR